MRRHRIAVDGGLTNYQAFLQKEGYEVIDLTKSSWEGAEARRVGNRKRFFTICRSTLPSKTRDTEQFHRASEQAGLQKSRHLRP